MSVRRWLAGNNKEQLAQRLSHAIGHNQILPENHHAFKHPAPCQQHCYCSVATKTLCLQAKHQHQQLWTRASTLLVCSKLDPNRDD
jgi:hypothetical protein